MTQIQMTHPPTIAFFPEASFGAALNCVAIAQSLAKRGAVPVFICHPGFTGIFADYGFKEYHLPPPAPQNDPSDYWQAFIKRHLPHFNLSPLDQLPTYVGPTWDAIVDTVIAAEAGLQTLLRQISPAAIVLDNVIMFPAVAQAGCPWVRVVSCAETELPDAAVPPYLSGQSMADPARVGFDRAYLQATKAAHQRYNDFRLASGLPRLPAGQFMETSDALNLVLSPKAVRYDRATPLIQPIFRYLEGCVRDEAQFDVPQFPNPDGPLVYLSFGSLGAMDTTLMDRMIRVFATIPARFIVNVGGFPEAYRHVPDNVFLGSWFPQPSVVAQSDLFIHHGGNNSFCEALYFGVPSLIIPYCWDGHDNATRAQETGVGHSLPRAGFTDEALRDAIQSLLADQAMAGCLCGIAAQMQADPGPDAAANAILAVV